MSEPARRNFIDEARATMKPDSQKGYPEAASDKLKEMSDNTASKVQPEGDKSMSQSAHDTVSGGAGSERRSSLMDKLKDTFSAQK